MPWRRKLAGRGRRGPHLNLATADVLHDRETLDSHRYGVVRHSLKCARDGLFSPAAAPPSTAKVEEQRDEAQDSRGDNQWNGVLDAATWVSGAHGALLVAVVAQGGRRRRRRWRSCWADHAGLAETDGGRNVVSWGFTRRRDCVTECE